jgi:hypothetical protein
MMLLSTASHDEKQSRILDTQCYCAQLGAVVSYHKQ